MNLATSLNPALRFGATVNIKVHDNLPSGLLKKAVALTELKEANEARIKNIQDQKDPLTLNFSISHSVLAGVPKDEITGTVISQNSGSASFSLDEQGIPFLFNNVLTKAESIAPALLSPAEKQAKQFATLNGIINPMFIDIADSNFRYMGQAPVSGTDIAHAPGGVKASLFKLGDKDLTLKKVLRSKETVYTLFYKTDTGAMYITLGLSKNAPGITEFTVHSISNGNASLESRICFTDGSFNLRDESLQTKMLAVTAKVKKIIEALEQQIPV